MKQSQEILGKSMISIINGKDIGHAVDRVRALGRHKSLELALKAVE
jgi:hypothetical protein